MSHKIKKRIQGSISILLIIILLPSMFFSALIVDFSRLNMAKSMVSSAADLTMNSVLADYDTILKDVYGLFAMSQNKTQEQLAADVQKYFEDTLVSYGVVDEAEAGNYVGMLMGDFNQLLSGTGSMEVSNFMQMEVGEDLKVSGVKGSGLDNPEILRKQIVDYMKYRGPANFGLSFLDSVKAFTVIEEQSKVVEAQVTAQESLQPVTMGCQTVMDGIREYDKTVLAINEGDQAVTGSDHSSDGVNIALRGYADQIKKYKETWGENYRSINRLALVYLLKVPGISDRYLSGMHFGENQLFIKENVMTVEGSGITLTVPTAGDIATAENLFISQVALLGIGSEYKNHATAYENANFLERSNLTTEKTAFNNREKARDAFIAYEAFLLGDTTRVSVTYAQIKDMLEQLYTLQQYKIKYMELLEIEINAAATALKNAEIVKNTKQSEMEKALKKWEDGKNAKTLTETAKKELDAANQVLAEAETAFAEAEEAVNNFTGNKMSAEYLTLKKAESDTKKVLEDATGDRDAKQNTYDQYAEAEPTPAELMQLEQAYQTKVTEYNKAAADYTVKSEALDNLNSKKENTDSKCENILSLYERCTYEYQHDLELYEEYRAIAKSMIDKEAAAIQTQVKKIEDNVIKLRDELSQIGIDLGTLESAIKSYDTNVEKWENANNSYASANSSDSFSKQNAADITATESQYNLESLRTLKEYIKVLIEEYDTFLNFIQKEGRFQYGTAKINSLTTHTDVVSAVPESVKNALADIVTEADADSKLDELYAEADEKIPTIEIDPLTFVTNGVIPIQFLKYLNENFPETKQELTLKTEMGSDGTEVTSDPEGEYNSMKESMKEDKEGQEKINSVDGNTYGYTFQDKAELNKETLPSNGRSGKEANEKSLAISSDDKGNINASSGMKAQNKKMNSVLGNVGSVLTTGLENVYIVDYIFQNFSYNTMVQERIVEGEKYDTYPQVMNLASLENLGEYKGKAKTLSNYTIFGSNNYLYGGEVEYILFGNAAPKKNVTYTKGSIYAIRFAFNSIFAFTDSEIRNTTMAAGMAVQAATMGIVPYQVVQIVLQLALAAAESAVDLDMMSKGLKTVVVKTRDTWTMSMSGAANLMKDAAVEVIDDFTKAAATYIKEGINTVMEATAEELNGAIIGLTETVTSAANSKAQEVIDSTYAEVQAVMDQMLNEIQFVNFSYRNESGTLVVLSQQRCKEIVEEKIQALKMTVEELPGKYAGNPIAEGMIPYIMPLLTGSNGIVFKVQEKINGIIDTTYEEASAVGEIPDIGTKICEQMLQIKYDLIGEIQTSIGYARNGIVQVTGEVIANTTQELTEQANQYVDNMTEEAAEKVKKQVSDSMNKFSNTYLKDAGAEDLALGTAGQEGGASTGSNVASMIKFGYKDYLMLLVFVYMCANDEAILCRIADLVQLNMQHATGVGENEETVFVHKKAKDFRMSEAKTYVSMTGTVKLEMLFLDMDFFYQMIGDGTADKDTQLDAASTIQYSGIVGY